MILIRTDGNEHLATGHLVRCLSIARMLEKKGKKVIFLVSDEKSQKLLKDLSLSLFSRDDISLECHVLKSARYDHLERELSELIPFLASLSSPMLLVDSYAVTPSYFTSLKPYARLAYMDDLRAFDYDVDLVINYDVIPENLRKVYENSYTKAEKCLLGAAYTPLRPQFWDTSYFVRDRIQDVLITTGGSDPYEFCEPMIRALLSLNPDLRLHLILGKLFTASSAAALESLASKNPHIQLYRSVSDMAGLMKQCDFAISAAGTTLYELCAIGVPSVSIAMADNQKVMAETFARTGAVPYAGDIRHPSSDPFLWDFDKIQDLLPKEEIQELPCRIASLIRTLDSAPRIRQSMYTKMRYLIDGKGAERIAKALCL